MAEVKKWFLATEDGKKWDYLKRVEIDASGAMQPFRTARYKYVPLPDGAPLGVRRWTEYEKLSIVLGFGRTFSGLVESLRKIFADLHDDKPMRQIRMEAALQIKTLIDGVVDLSKERFSIGFYLATIFIVREGDDPAKWDIAIANDMIEDWQTQNLDEQALFFFALNRVENYRNVLKELKADALKRREKLLADIGLRAKSPSDLETNFLETSDGRLNT